MNKMMPILALNGFFVSDKDTVYKRETYRSSLIPDDEKEINDVSKQHSRAGKISAQSFLTPTPDQLHILSFKMCVSNWANQNRREINQDYTEGLI